MGLKKRGKKYFTCRKCREKTSGYIGAIYCTVCEPPPKTICTVCGLATKPSPDDMCGDCRHKQTKIIENRKPKNKPSVTKKWNHPTNTEESGMVQSMIRYYIGPIEPSGPVKVYDKNSTEFDELRRLYETRTTSRRNNQTQSNAR